MTRFEKDMEIAKKGGSVYDHMMERREQVIRTITAELKRETRPSWIAGTQELLDKYNREYDELVYAAR